MKQLGIPMNRNQSPCLSPKVPKEWAASMYFYYSVFEKPKSPSKIQLVFYNSLTAHLYIVSMVLTTSMTVLACYLGSKYVCVYSTQYQYLEINLHLSLDLQLCPAVAWVVGT